MSPETTVVPDFGSSTLDFPGVRPPEREMGGGRSGGSLVLSNVREESTGVPRP